LPLGNPLFGDGVCHSSGTNFQSTIMENYRITNRENNNVYIFNAKEVASFFKINKISKYEVISFSHLNQIKTDKILLIIQCLAIIGTSLYLLSKWI
jgi:hypothetical protein